jgi:tRNA (cytidine/uridine-2'-O-)-methyltransferase
MFHIVLYQPEIPPNTGNIIRLCANTGCQLHLIGPLGFDLDDRRLRRAGLDYREWASVAVYGSLEDCLDSVRPNRLWALSTRGRQHYTQVGYRARDALLFGPETRGLPDSIVDDLDPGQVIRVPMVADSRSLNLSNAAALVLYEAWRQNGFAGGR